MADQRPDDDAPDDASDAALLEAIEAAARAVGSGQDEPEAGAHARADADTSPTPRGVVLRFDAPHTSRRRLWWLTAVLVLTSAGAAYLSLRPRGEPPPEKVEADLRWAVAQVVRRVEAFRNQTGHLPATRDLQGLVSDLVVYEPLAEGYWVYGQRGAVRVEFDGTIPLPRWEKLRLYGRSGEAP